MLLPLRLQLEAHSLPQRPPVSALSLGLLWAIRKARGRWSYTDAFLPIVLLNLGQADAFSWAQTFAYLSATCLETLLLIVIVTHRGALNRTSMVLAGATLILLPLTFGGGVVFAAMMVPWMIYEGWVVKRKHRAVQSPCLPDRAGFGVGHGH